MVDSKRFWIAPKVLRRLLTAVRAASTRVMAVLAFAAVVTLTLDSACAPRAREPGAVKPAFAGVLPPMMMVSAAVRRIEPIAVRLVVAPCAVLKFSASLSVLFVPALVPLKPSFAPPAAP